MRPLVPRLTVPLLLKLHRWIAIALSPVLLLLTLSGAILAFKPVADDAHRVAVDVPALVSALEQADPQGRAGTLSIAPDGKTFTLASRRDGPTGVFDMATGARRGEAGFDVFEAMRRLHVNLMVGADWLVTLGTVAMVALIVSGLLFNWRSLRNTLSGWHVGMGWLSLPLMALTPVTGLLMAFHLGMSPLPRYAGTAHPLPLAQVLHIAGEQTDLGKLMRVRNFRRGGVMLSVQRAGVSPATYIVAGTGQFVRMDEAGWVRMLHIGNWAGAYSGVLTFLSTLPLFGLLFTGLLAWWRRRGRLTKRAPLDAVRANA
ncbi:MAG: PepSY-associated TM helix domain-containing protein [Rhodocyclaceae bacterium]